MSEQAKDTTENKKDEKKSNSKADPKVKALEAKVDELVQIIDLLAVNSGMGKRVAILRDKIKNPDKYKGDKLKKVS